MGIAPAREAKAGLARIESEITRAALFLCTPRRGETKNYLELEEGMSSDRGSLVMCGVCEERVAELVADDGRVPCSVCKLEEMGERSCSEKDSDWRDA